MNLLDLMVKIGIDDEVSGKIGGVADGVKSKMAAIGSAAATGFAAIGAGATAAVGALLSVEAATEEYRIAQGKLNTAFETAGYSLGDAKQAYTDFYKILGDTDTAAEASQLLAKLSLSQEDLSTWTNIATGVWGTFGDSLPIEGLIEASNETAKVGTVTGTLADALNWAGISEDEFNEKLAACSDESERNQLIMDTLSGTYDEAAQSFRDNNQAIMESRENQIMLQDSLSKVGEAVTNVKNSLLESFAPAIQTASDTLADFLNNLDFSDASAGATEALNAITEALSPITETVQEISPIFQDLFTTITETFTPLADDLQGAWTSISEGISAGLESFSAMVDESLIPAIEMCQPYLDDFFQAIEDAQPTFEMLGSFIGTVAGIIAVVLVEAFMLAVAAATAVINAVNDFVTFLQGVPDAVSQFVTDVSNWFQQLPGRIQEFLNQIISDLQQWVSDTVQKAQEAGQQFLDAVNTKFGEVTSFFQDLPNKILSALGDLGSLLWDAGTSIINGLWNGLKSKWEEVTGWFSSITSQIPDLKGPIEVDAKLLVGNGETIMGGLLRGLESGWSDVEGFLSSKTMDIPTTFSSGYNGSAQNVRTAMAPGKTEIVQNFYQPVQSAAEFARAQRKMNNYGLAGARG